MEITHFNVMTQIITFQTHWQNLELPLEERPVRPGGVVSGGTFVKMKIETILAYFFMQYSPGTVSFLASTRIIRSVLTSTITRYLWVSRRGASDVPVRSRIDMSHLSFNSPYSTVFVLPR